MVMPVRMASGKFQGAITTATPRGKCKNRFSSPGTSRPALRLQGDGLAGVEFAKVDGFANVGVCFAPLFAAFVDFPSGQLKAAFAHDLRRAAQIFGAFFDRPALHAGRAARGGHGTIGFGSPEAATMPTTRSLSEGSIDSN